MESANPGMEGYGHLAAGLENIAAAAAAAKDMGQAMEERLTVYLEPIVGPGFIKM